MRASDSPSSRPPSRRCTDTFTRVPCLASARGGAFGASVAAPVGSGPPSAACVISTSLMECQPQPMIAPAYRYPTRLSETCRTSTRCPVALRWPASIEDPLRTRHALRHALDLGGTSGEGGVEAPGDLVCDRLGKLRLGEDDEVVTADVAGKVPAVGFLLEDLEDDRGQRLDHVVASHEAVVVVVALEGVDVRIEDREAFVRDQSLRDLAQDVGVAAHPGERVELAGGRRSRDDGPQARHELLWDEGFGHVVVGAFEEVVDLVLERAADGQENNGDQPRAEVLAQLEQDLLARGRAEHEVEHDDVRTPVHRGVVRHVAVADGHALEARPFEDALEELEHLLVVVDDEDEISTRLGHLRRCLACGARPAHGTHDIPAAGSESGASARRRRSWSTSSSARSAAVRISAMSALTASGSLVSSAISSQ